MYIYFDRNGTIKEVINDESIRRGSSDYNKIYCYLEGNPDIDDIWYLQKNPDGTLTNEVSFADNVVTKAIPYDSHRDMKYFQDFVEYQFYTFTLTSSYLSQNGLVVATIRVAENNTLWALGELTFNVQANIVNSDNDITQSQYDYLLLTISSYYSKTEIDNKLSLKADKSDTYTKAQTDNLLNLKADKSNTYTKTEVDSALSLKADKSNTYTKTEVDEKLDLKADKSDTYTKQESDNKFAPKSNAVTHTGNQLQDYSGNNIYPNTNMDDLVPSINDFMQSGEGVLIENNIVGGLNKFNETSITNASIKLGSLYNTYKIKYPTNTAISNNVISDNLGYKTITFNATLNSTGQGKVAFRQYNSNGEQVSFGSKTITESGEYSITTNSSCRQIRIELSFVSNTGAVNDDTLEVFNFRSYTNESIEKGVNLKEKVDKINGHLSSIDGHLSSIDEELSKIKTLQTPVLLLNFDAWNITDGRYDILKEYGLRATVVSISSEVDRQMLQDGFDVSAYTSTNWPYNTYGNDALSDTPTQEVQEAWDSYVYNYIQTLKTRGTFNVTAWFCRQNKMCVGLKNALEKYGVTMARGSYPATSSYPTKLYFDDDFSFSNGTLNLTPDNYNACVNALNNAVTNGYGISIFSHGIYATTEEANANYGMTETMFRNFLDLVKNHIENNNLKVITYREMYALYKPIEANQNDYNRLIKMISNA